MPSISLFKDKGTVVLQQLARKAIYFFKSLLIELLHSLIMLLCGFLFQSFEKIFMGFMLIFEPSGTCLKKLVHNTNIKSHTWILTLKIYSAWL
jgi:hypothetical protein